MKITKYIFALLVSLSSVNAISADTNISDTKYRRSSLCSFLISRTDQSMFDRIQDKYLEIPTPDQYNDHNLSLRVINVGKKAQYADSIDNWLNDNFVASRLVGRWFDRNIIDGTCSMDTIKSRGLYNATEFDKELAKRSVKGMAMLSDAGEELIGNTFVLVHEAHYIDNAKRSKNVATGLRVLGALGGAFLGSGFGNLMDDLGDIAETFKGFRVKFHTRLYQLVWDDETSGTFYKSYYSANPDANKAAAFEANRGLFHLKYLGEVESSGSQNSFLGISEAHPDVMIRKACQRAIDDNVRDLQKAFEVFRVKSPVIAVNGDEVQVPIGMKEGLNEDSEYEVLEPEEKDGRVKYKRIGMIKPVAGKIWDNRYMAREEGAVGSDLHASTFKVSSGSKPYEGVLVRQVK